jgi:hypothetical protein
MTFEEKVAMWSEKKRFIESLDQVFKKRPKGSSVDTVFYEVYQKEINGSVGYAEWLVIRFDGGGFLAVRVTGNSNTANFQVIADYIHGGYYDEVRTYQTLLDNGWEMVTL